MTCRAEAARRGWQRRGFGTCAYCHASQTRLYCVPVLHPERDLCIECAWSLGNRQSPAPAAEAKPE